MVPFDTNSPSDTPGVPATSSGFSSCETNGDVWFSFTPTSSGSYRFETCGGTFDTELTLYQGGCGNPLELGCSDNSCGLSSQLTLGLNAGTEYLLSLGFADDLTMAWGAGTLSVSEITFPAASGSVNAWANGVSLGTQPTFTSTDIPGPTRVDLGSNVGANGMTYEFIVHGTAANVSSCLLGSLDPGSGDSAAMKFEQYADTLSYGVTEFGVADHVFAGGGLTQNTDLHLAYAADTSVGETELFVNGVSIGTVPAAPVLAGMTGVGQILRAGGVTLDTFDGVIRGMAVYDALLGAAEIQDHADRYFSGALGTNYCGPGAINSNGTSGVMGASGSTQVADNDVVLEASELPRFVFAFFITSPTQGFVANPGGSLGNICLAGSVGRYVGPGQVQNTLGAGSVSLTLDLFAIPQPNGFVAVIPGETWNFQCWHRDSSQGNPASNFTDGLEITFL